MGIQATINITEKTGAVAGLKIVRRQRGRSCSSTTTGIDHPHERLEKVNVIFGRDTQGVRLMRVDEGTRVVSVEVVPHAEEEAAAETPETPAPVQE